MKASSSDSPHLISPGWILSGVGVALLSWGFMDRYAEEALTITNLFALLEISACVALLIAVLASFLAGYDNTWQLRWLALSGATSSIFCLAPWLGLNLGWINPEHLAGNIAWFWLAERCLGSFAALQFARQKPAASAAETLILNLLWIALSVALSVLILGVGTHSFGLANTTLSRPWAILPGLLYFAAFVLLLIRLNAQLSGFGTCVLLFLLLNFCLQFAFAPFTLDMLDTYFRASLLLRLFALLLLFLGLCFWLRSQLRNLTQQRLELQINADAALQTTMPSTAEHIVDTSPLVSRKVLLSLMEDFHRAREQEADAKQFAESIIENMPMMIFVKDAKDLRFQRINKAGEQLLGVPREQLMGKTDYDLFSREQADFFTSTDYNTLQRGTVVDVSEEPINTPEGIRWLHTRKIPVHSARGNSLFLLGISEDITERRELEQRFTLLFDVAPNGLMLVKQDTTIVLANKACCDIFGYHRDELIDQRLHQLLPDRIKHGHTDLMHHYWADPRPLKMTANPNLVGVHKDGHNIPLDIALQPLPWQGELYVLAAITDITERQRFIEELEQTNRYKTQFLANMSHELRTPMNSIIGFTEKVLKNAGASLNERNEDALLTVQRNAHHLLRLINDILDLSKIEAGKMEVEQDAVELRQQLEIVRAEYAQMAKTKNLTFTMELPNEEIHLHTDHRKLLQVCNNLMSNAVKYTEQGSVTLKVSVESHPELGRSATLQFIDTGIGITDEDQEKLFTEFGRASEARQKNIQGTGLGLLITAQLVGLLGGRINAESKHGKGSVFTVVLPLEKNPHG